MFFQDSLAATGTGENPKAQEEGGRLGGPREQLDWVGAHGGHWWLWYISHVELSWNLNPRLLALCQVTFPLTQLILLL